MYIFPIKSCAPVVVNVMQCSNLGAQNGHLRDRVFMVVRSTTHEYVMPMHYSRMVLITPHINGNMLTITAPAMEEISLDITVLYQSNNAVRVKVEKDQVLAIDCGDVVAKWFSKFLLKSDSGLRLVFYPSSEPKPFVQPKGYMFKTADRIDTGALHGETSYMLMNMGSFDDLNANLDRPVTPLQFRPNFVVSGAPAWAEDKWKFIRIGDEVVFRTLQPCLRCSNTLVDPTTGERSKNQEPLSTLRRFRVFLNLHPRDPVFGIHLGLRRAGIIRTGDAVYVSY